MWPVRALSAIADIFGGGTPRRDEDRFWGGGIPWLTPTDLPEIGSWIVEVEHTRDTITQEGLRNSSTNLLPPGSVLFSSRATIGKIGIAKTALATNQGFVNLVPRPGIDARFLAYALRFFTPQIAALAGSTTFREVNRGSIRKFKIPTPALSEQRRIVEILDQADKLRQRRSEVATKIERILPALFYKMFGAPSTWQLEKTVPLGDIVDLVSGATPSRENREYWRGSVPWVSPKDIKRERVTDSEEHVSDTAVANTRLKLLHPGAILIVVRGMILARTVPISLADTCLTINQDLKGLVLRDARFNSEYLWAAMKMMEPHLFGFVSTAAHGTRKLDTDVLLETRVLIPATHTAEQFRRAAGDALSLLDGQRESSSLVEGLFRCLLQRAFTGDLTDKWRERNLPALLLEMEEQARELGLPTKNAGEAASL